MASERASAPRFRRRPTGPARGARWGVSSLFVAGVLPSAGVGGRAEQAPLARDPELEALQEAVRGPDADVQAILVLVGRLVAAGRDRHAHAYFEERARAAPDRPLFLALEGFFQARAAGGVFLLRRPAWIRDAVAKLDRAVARDPGLPRYFRGLVLAELPARFGKAEAAVDDLQWVLQQRDRFPAGLRRSAHRGLARAYTTLGRAAEARAALQRSGLPSLDPRLPVFTTDSVTAKEGFRFRPPRLAELAPGVHVAQGYDFADIAFVLTADGIVAIDAGTTEANARAALAALRRVATQPITHVILTHAHWDHVGASQPSRDRPHGSSRRPASRASSRSSTRPASPSGISSAAAPPAGTSWSPTASWTAGRA